MGAEGRAEAGCIEVGLAVHPWPSRGHPSMTKSNSLYLSHVSPTSHPSKSSYFTAGIQVWRVAVCMSAMVCLSYSILNIP